MGVSQHHLTRDLLEACLPRESVAIDPHMCNPQRFCLQKLLVLLHGIQCGALIEEI